LAIYKRESARGEVEHFPPKEKEPSARWTKFRLPAVSMPSGTRALFPEKRRKGKKKTRKPAGYYDLSCRSTGKAPDQFREGLSSETDKPFLTSYEKGERNAQGGL